MPTLILTPPARQSAPTSIFIESGAIDRLAESLKPLGQFDAYVVLFDRGVKAIANRVVGQLGAETLRVHAIAVESGDASKSLQEADAIAARMLEAQCGRSTLLIAVGGGMLTDLGGFVASVFMRGIPSVLIPTSMLAMADAAIGGKNAVNCADHKNMIGTIYHPLAVVSDLDLLKTLPIAQLHEGLVEVIKIAAIKDATFFAWLEANLKKVLARDPKALEECMTQAVSVKIATVETDEADWSERLYLNFGHTIGHAIEATSHYHLSHGQAVAIGMMAEMKVTGFTDIKRVEKLLFALELPLSLPPEFSADDLWHLMLTDKKTERGSVRIAVPSVIGTGSLHTLERSGFDSLFGK